MRPHTDTAANTLSGMSWQAVGSAPHWRCLAMVVLLMWLWSQPVAAQQFLGNDFSFAWHEDRSGQLDLDAFLSLPKDALTESDRIVSLGYSKSTLWYRLFLPADDFEGQERWLQVGPGFVDQLTVFYRRVDADGFAEPWQQRELGDLNSRRDSDLDYRFPVLRLPAPGDGTYDLVVRASSSSAVLIDLSLWPVAKFVKHSALSTAFWSFYFGLAAFATGLALLMAASLHRRLVWAMAAFSLTYVLVACTQGFVGWLLSPWWGAAQHYLTAILTLWAYASVLWLCAESLDYRTLRPRLYRFVLGVVGFNLLLQLSIPFNFYGLAMKIQGVICAVSALLFAASAAPRWRREGWGVSLVLLGLMPAIYVSAGFLVVMSLVGWLPYHRMVYALWQYVLIANMLLAAWVAVSRVRQENRLMREKQQLIQELDIEREASFHQRQFMGMVAHEFRTPLTVIGSALENLRLPGLTESQRQSRYNKITRAQSRLVQLTDNCLADSRLDGTSLLLQREWVDLFAIIRSATELADGFKPERWQLQINGMVQKTDDAASFELQADPGLLRIALSNLFDNAAKYAPLGTVEVDVLLPDTAASHAQGVQDQNPPQIRILVKDQGPGVPSHEAEIIFERYQQGTVGTGHRGSIGVGLGLAVARQIARAHDGDLTLLTGMASGSCFELRLPLLDSTVARPT